MKGSFKIDDSIISKVDRYKCGALLFSRTNKGVV